MIYLNVCGLRNSPPDHWHSHWERQYPDSFQRVEQTNWAAPDNTAWTSRLNHHLASFPTETEICLIGHSVGCATIVNCLRDYDMASFNIKAALLVAPSDVEQSDYPTYITGFAPLHLSTLPFPSLVVASSNDHVVRPARARFFADCWASEFHLLKDAGHVEAKSGFGLWPAGLKLLSQISGSDLA